MDTLQANDFMERVRNIMASYTEIEEPNPNWKNGRG
jgi:hypothetical protein